MKRVRDRFLERTKTRDPAITASLVDTYIEDTRDTAIAQFFLNRENYKSSAKEATNAHREYMAKEGVQQYRDYYESEAEEQGFFEYLDNLPNRDRIRFMECFEDFTVDKISTKRFKTIPKREFNPELSAFSNLVLDMADFKDRVRPLARDITLLDVTSRFQARNPDEARIYAGFKAEMREEKTDFSEKKAISDQSAGEDAAVPEYKLNFKKKSKKSKK